jgi:hypothetical protein
MYIDAELAGGESDIAIPTFTTEELKTAVTSLATLLNDALRVISAEKVTVEFGLQVGVEAGQLISLVTKGTVASNFRIAVEWTRQPQK